MRLAFGAKRLWEGFVRARPPWAATAVVAAVLPAISQLFDTFVHYIRGTPELARSTVVSLAVSAVSSVFCLFAMRRGARDVHAKEASCSAQTDRRSLLLGRYTGTLGA